MSNFDDLLKQALKHRKIKKVKFKKGKVWKMPSLLGTTKQKVIKQRHYLIPLNSPRVQRHIAIDLSGAPAFKRRLYKTKIPTNQRIKFTKEQIEQYKKFGAGVFVGRLKPFINQYDRDYLYGYANHIIANKGSYKKKEVDDARNYLLVHSRFGYAKLTKQYFLGKYGNTKLRTLKDDPIYQNLKKMHKHASSPAEQRRVERLMESRKKQNAHRLADAAMVEYRAELKDKRQPGAGTAQYYARYEKMLDPSIQTYWNFISKELQKIMEKQVWGTNEEFYRQFYSKFDGVDPGYAIGRLREEYAYQKLIEWLIDTGLQVPLHSTNLHSLKNPSFLMTVRMKLENEFSREQIDEWIRDNITNPHNLSRSGLPDPFVHRKSLWKYMRETPQGMYPGQEIEKEITKRMADIENEFTKEYRRFADTEKKLREQIEEDFRNYAPPADISRHFQMVIESRKKTNDLKKYKKGKK